VLGYTPVLIVLKKNGTYYCLSKALNWNNFTKVASQVVWDGFYVGGTKYELPFSTDH